MALFPPTEEKILINNQILDCGHEKVKNRIRAYIHKNTPSQGRYERMNAMLGKLYERVSAGVHKDVTSDEAKAVVLGTYLLLGEIVTLESDVPSRTRRRKGTNRVEEEWTSSESGAEGTVGTTAAQGLGNADPGPERIIGCSASRWQGGGRFDLGHRPQPNLDARAADPGGSGKNGLARIPMIV
jgi:hypothetical protein